MIRVALVTGAARGIGAATCHRLAADGWAVVAVDRAADDPRLPYALGTRAELDGVAEACLGAGAAGAEAVVADAADPEDARRAVARAEDVFGGLDAVVAAAGVVAGGAPLWEVEAAAVDAVLDGCLSSVVTLARAAVPALLRRPEPRTGRFLAVASVAAHRGLPQLAAYCAAKAGVVGLMRALALELAGSGVTAATVSPGSTDTAILAESARLYGLEGGATAFAARQPVGRLLDADEVAATLAWLAGPGGAAITGSDVLVDGGLAL
jgi:SDR family mycofactocin-dependent oxidoreductase